MMIIDDNRVCPVCSGYSQREGDGHCTNGHFVKDEDWITQKEFNERKYLAPRVECVEFQTIWDGGIEKYTPALLSLATGEITVKLNEIDGLYFRDSQSIIIKYKSGLTAVYDVIDDAGDYRVSEEDISSIRALYESADKHKSAEPKLWSSNHVQDIETDKASFEVYECTCGYHMGFDASYLDQVDGNISAECPSCHNTIHTRTITDEDQNQSYVRIDEFTYHFQQGWNSPQPGTDEISFDEEVIDIRKYNEDEIEKALAFFQLSLESIANEGYDRNAMIAECLFEYKYSA